MGKIARAWGLVLALSCVPWSPGAACMEDEAPRDGSSLPGVLLVGDSISLGYTPFVKQYLYGLAEVEHNPGNGGDTWRGLEHLEEWLGRKKWAVIHFNWGLWDLCWRNPDAKNPGHRDKVKGTLTSTQEQYDRNLRRLTARLEKTGARLIWAATTPVPPGEAGRFQGDAARYNRVAAQVMKERGIPVDDLYALAKAECMDRFRAPGDVHFTPEGYRILARGVACAVLRALGEAHPGPLVPRLFPYKQVGEGKEAKTFHLHGFLPAGWKPSDRRGAAVFFFGGGWSSGKVTQFYPFCRALSRRGMVAFSAEYRVKRRDGVAPPACVEDAKDAVRYVRAHAADLGVDPERITAAGGSAGGHLAACTAMITDAEENASIATSPAPQALILFNPVLDTTTFQDLKARLGADAERISPLHHVRPGLPPVLLFHGTGDTTVPFSQAEAFARAMEAAGNRVELVPADGAEHGFFNFGRHGNRWFERARDRMITFLEGLGFFENRAGTGAREAGEERSFFPHSPAGLKGP